MPTTTSQKHVLLVDDDPWTRSGVIATLGADLRLVVQAERVAGALAHESPTGKDVLVIDVCDRSDPVDRYRGVEVIARLRHAEADGERRCFVVVMVTEPVDPLLVVRVAEAGADEVRTWGETGEAELLALVSEGTTAEPLETSTLKEALGLDPSGSVNDFLAELHQEDLLHVFTPGTTQQGSGVARRRSMALRRRAMEVAGLRSTAALRDRPLLVPTWREVRAFVNAARGLEAISRTGPLPLELRRSDLDRYTSVS